MTTVKTNTLFLDDESDTDNAVLFAIHSSQEIFRVAYLLNEYLELGLARTNQDIDLFCHDGVSFHPLYHFFDQRNLLDCYLVSNKSKASVKNADVKPGLFMESSGFHNFLVPEYKNVDFFLKIDGTEEPELFLAQLKKIKPITAIYPVDIARLKSYKNLIFD